MEPNDFTGSLKMVRITRVINGQKQTVSLSTETAAEIGFHSPFENLPFPLAEILQTLFGKDELTEQVLAAENLTCPGCGLEFEDFKQTGRLGCGDCYDAFRPQLDWILQELHGASRHIGGTPEMSHELANSLGEKESLQSELDEAIAVENYERAAELRDQIQQLETVR